MIKKFIFFILIFVCFCEGKVPPLTNQDVDVKIQEILNAHVLYQKLTPMLIERILKNYIDELDPAKMYFMESDIQKWIAPSEETVQNFLRQTEGANYKPFMEIHEAMISAIKRYNELEKGIEPKNLPKEQLETIKDLPWTKNKEELIARILKIKAMQLMVSDKLNSDEKEKFVELLKKRRLHRELNIIGSSLEEREKILLTYVLKSTSSALDAHTNYFTPSEAEQFVIQVQQRLFGIGVQLKDNLNGFKVERILDGSPASKNNKLKVNDLIIAVNNEHVVGMDITESVELIRGEKGTPVSLTILREDPNTKEMQKMEIEITRGEVVLEESRLETSFEPYGDGIIAHLHLFSFYQDPKSSSTNDIKKAINNLKKDYNIKGILLDLRNNGGGLLPQAVNVAGLFLTKGIVVSVKDNTGQIQHLRNTEDKMFWDGALIVLTNKASASAAEIVAQTLQDYGRAIVVGDKQTFGKGTFQSFSLDATHNAKVNPKGEFKVTRGLYYTVSGKSPQLKGVQANIVVPGIFSEANFGEDQEKYPLPISEINPNFVDDLSDIPPIHRARIKLLYKSHLQQKIALYDPYMNTLKSNSEKRIKENKSYQKFLEEMKKKQFYSQEIVEQTDLQLDEAYNILKDLIFLEEIKEKYAASY